MDRKPFIVEMFMGIGFGIVILALLALLSLPIGAAIMLWRAVLA